MNAQEAVRGSSSWIMDTDVFNAETSDYKTTPTRIKMMRLKKSASLSALVKQNPMANYLRKRPNLRITRFLRVVLQGVRSNSNHLQGTFVPLDSLLCGGGNWLSAATFARHTDDFLYPSRPISRSPHVQFLEEYTRIGADIFRPEVFRGTAYFKHAVQFMNTTGHYLRRTREDQIEDIARRFVAQFSDDLSLNDLRGDFSHNGPKNDLFSPPGSLAVVRPIRYSRCYEVIDGHHRIAIAYVRGEKEYRVRVRGAPVLTPLQQLLLDCAWDPGKRILIQPIESPELEDDWVLLRRCSDRMELMRDFLEEHKCFPPRCTTYLDIGCAYGFFVKAFKKLGFKAYGVERDWAAVEIARLVFGLENNSISRSEIVGFLKNHQRDYDIVSCLSLLHHFILGRGSISGEELLRLVDSKTRTVLFLDTGQNHEEWFRNNLSEWSVDYIEQWLRENSSFKRIYRLGADHDNFPPHEQNYKRMLFACMR